MKLLIHLCENLHKSRFSYCLTAILFFSVCQNSAFAQTNGKDRTGKLTITSKPTGALVYMAGEYEFIGRTPFVIPYQLYGRYNIKVNKRGYESIHSYYRFTAERRAISIRLKPKKASKAFFRSTIFPGWGQFYSERKFMGTVYVGASAAALTVLTLNQHRYKDAQFTYQNALAKANREGTSFEEQQQAQDDLQDALRNLNSRKDTRNTSLYIAIGVWVFNMLDSMLFFPNYAEDIEFFQKLGLQADPQQNSIRLTMQLPVK
ncbi:MAG: DUF5683 domain-containing protein [bacterium]